LLLDGLVQNLRGAVVTLAAVSICFETGRQLLDPRIEHALGAPLGILRFDDIRLIFANMPTVITPCFFCLNYRQGNQFTWVNSGWTSTIIRE